MTISSTGKTVSPRQKRAKLKGETTVEVENNQGQSLNKEQVEPNAELSVEASEQEQIHGKLAVAGAHSITGSNWEIAGTISIAGLRPISTSTLEVVETIDIMGLRPITAHTFNIVDSINLSGIRPIASSSLVLSSTYSSMGDRPVASNTIDDSDSLMGFID
ncbi:conserved hypothetical protein [Trichormus variabilis ATCC 29413]|uniref:Uncharacterized protein n=2 Tax=Anabaena variabilis TaxID=264691 RepID=Q3M410_TRIV2|nr:MULTISPECIES: hypothetical protein [Nostocaceae]ABA24276.1 conserved hypothetical protein [Trichormus variabilis ATCC 29413]MBC1216351.1 hypothetical protein [Trichormus variabilis ARAD]MBC1258886.1 hypothetical protein [Trichormus variabilis V5]MBC1269651.1 hypothetical protein [Trichormus variabilis FSR]MBC1301881.1 hypothetical protein [Trichormus variabilis N2B]